MKPNGVLKHAPSCGYKEKFKIKQFGFTVTKKEVRWIPAEDTYSSTPEISYFRQGKKYAFKRIGLTKYLALDTDDSDVVGSDNY